MATVSLRQRLDELLGQSLDRENFEELVRCIYHSYTNVDLTDSRIRQMHKELDGLKGSERRAMAEKLGILHFARGDYREAVELLGEAPASKTARHFLGRALLKLGRAGEALEALARGRTGDDDLSTDVLTVEAHCDLGDYESAEQVISNYEESEEEPAELVYARGRVAETRGEYGVATALYEKAIEKDPEYAPALFRLALNCDLNGEDERAMELYRRCANLQPSFVGPLINLGVLYEDHGKYEEAIECYKRVLAIEPTHRRAQLYLKDAESSLTMYIEVSASPRMRTMEEIFSLPEGGEGGYGALPEAALDDLDEEEDESEGPTAAEALAAGDEMPVQEKLNISVESLELSTRARKCMERLGVRTVGELLQLSKKQLLAAPNFGTTSLKEIETKLGALGLSLKSD